MKEYDNEMILKETGVIKMKAELKRDINSYLKYCNEEDLQIIVDYIKNLQGVNHLCTELNENKNLLLLTEYYDKIRGLYQNYWVNNIKFSKLYDYLESSLYDKILMFFSYLRKQIKSIHKTTRYGINKEFVVKYSNSKTYNEHLIDICTHIEQIASNTHSTIKCLEKLATQVYKMNDNSLYLVQEIIKDMEMLYQNMINIEEYFYEELKYQESINN